VQAFGQEQAEVRNYERHLVTARDTGLKTHFKSSLALSSFMFVIFGYYAYGFYTGSWLITKQIENSNSGAVYNIGDILSCFFGIVFGVMSLGMSAPQLKSITEGTVAGKMAYDIIDRQPKISLDDPSALALSRDKVVGRLELSNVTFRYPSKQDQLILDNFSAVFEEGKTTALVGASGSGKSTIIQLLERFYDPETGTVTLDGEDLKNVNLKLYRRNFVGYVSQEPILFNCSIRDNLRYAKPDATDQEIIDALKSANAWDFVSALGKDGIHTNVGNAGNQLSGGQKQRIAIARAFIKKPKILLLDEATSALDKRNEREVQGAIDRIRNELGSVTTVVVAHRLSTIRNSDKIIVMSKGKIIEVGTHDSLLVDFPEGTYAKFVREQEQSEEQAEKSTPQLLADEGATATTDKKAKPKTKEEEAREALEAEMKARYD
jgi:ATP-binding cassette, subfamily B (MDR/TAP), member 1